MTSRRTALRWFAASSGLAALAPKPAAAEPLVKHGRIKQSIVHWCFERGAKWKVADTVKAALELGCVSVEGCAPEHWDLLKDLGCDIAQGYYIAKPMPSSDFQKWAEDFRKSQSRDSSSFSR